MSKNLMDDFTQVEAIELDIPERKGFKYIPSTAGQENDWLKLYWKVDPGTKLGYNDHGVLNKCKMENLVEVPYGIEEIKQLINVEKEWKNLDKDQRWNVLERLKPKIFTLIINAIELVDNPKIEDVKN